MVKLPKQTNKKTENTTDTKFIVVITVKLLVISMITALLLSCVNALTVNKIAENAEREKAEAISSIFPEAESNTPLENVLFEGMSAVYKVHAGENILGYVAEVNPLGFGGEMTVMVGVCTDGTVAGVKLISHSETPGLGSRVEDANYLGQYVGKDKSTLKPKVDIDIITGSTVSSNAILDAVNNAVSIHKMIFPGSLMGGTK